MPGLPLVHKQEQDVQSLREAARLAWNRSLSHEQDYIDLQISSDSKEKGTQVQETPFGQSF